MEGQIGDFLAFLKGLQAQMDEKHEVMKKTLEANTSVLQELTGWKPKVQVDVEDIQSCVRDLCTKVNHLAVKQEESSNPAYKVFDTEHLDLSGSPAILASTKPYGVSFGLVGHGVETSNRGSGNGVVTTPVPTPIIGMRTPKTLILMALPFVHPYTSDMSYYHLNHALPPVEFPEFDGSSPKLWIKKCNNYFDIYAVPEFLKSNTAQMHFSGNADFWAQSLEYSVQDLAWPDLCKAICERFEKDQHNQLLRQFFRIKQHDGVAEYIEKFDNIVHQILAHDPKFSVATITNRFVDGLKDEMRAIVLIHRPENLDTASSIALLQEESGKDPPKREFKKNDYGGAFKYRSSYTNVGSTSTTPKGAESGPNSSRKGPDITRSSYSEDKAATLMTYRKAKGLCYKCGLKQGPGHKCANSVSLHVVEGLWQMLHADEPELLEEI